ncbi:MAG: hypothetical protein L3J15_04740 [Devosiaceae bacterium]|nr:hypothetical protein [Devosiaceae bacterium]
MANKINKFFSGLIDSEVWDVYALSIEELKNRKLIRTRNIVGERGEFLAIETYNKTSGLSNLQAAPEGTQNVDAISRKGERYSIKTITAPRKTTGVFYNCGNQGDESAPDQKFEFVLVVIIGKNFQLENLYELTWVQFLKYKKWHKTMKAWNLSVTKDLIANANKIYKKPN